MTIIGYDFRCAECNSHFLAPVAEGYGQLIMRSEKRGVPRVLHGPEDKAYQQVDAILREVDADAKMNTRAKVELLWTVFGVACDRDEDGSEFKIGAMPICPSCGSRNMASWGSTGKLYQEAVLEVTHCAWETLSPAQQYRSVIERIRAARS
jgi:hypothetical protein